MSRNLSKRVEMERTLPEAYVPANSAAFYVPPPDGAVFGENLPLQSLTAPLWRGKFAILAVTVLGVAAGIGISALMKPVYRARASVQIEAFNNDQFLREITPVTSSLPNSTPDNVLQNEVKLLQSETLARRVADRLQLDPPDAGPGRLMSFLEQYFSFLRIPYVPREERRIRAVQRALDVRTSLQSQVIEIFYEAPDAALSASGANTVASEFVNLNREARFQLAKDTTEWLNQQAAELKASLEKTNEQLQDYARESGLVFAGKQSTLAEDRMRQVQDALSKAEADRALKQARFEAAVTNPDSVMSDALASGPLRQYETDLQKLQRDLADLQTVYTPANYKVQRVKAQIDETEKSIRAERDNIIARLRTEYVAAASLERLLAQTQEQQLKTVEQQMDRERRYDVKKSEADATQRLYESMLQKVKEAGAASALRTTNVRIIDPAGAPSSPYSPNLPLNAAVGMVLGCLTGVGLVLIGEGSAKVKQPGETTLLDLPELGVIPSATRALASSPSGQGLPVLRRKSVSLGLLVPEAGSILSEAFQAALTSILFSASLHRRPGNRGGGRIVVVTSIDMMEGKTTVLSNLGAAAAGRRQRVCLVDADLRRPRVHELAGVPNDEGLSDLLQREDFAGFIENAPIEDLAVPTKIPGLWVLPSGRLNTAVPSLLYSPDIGLLLVRLRKEFDLVLIDTPPMMMYADGRVLGRVSDGVVLVVRANTRSREEVRSAYLRLIQDQIPVLGTILNGWRMDAGQKRAYSRYYSHYRARPA